MSAPLPIEGGPRTRTRRAILDAAMVVLAGNPTASLGDIAVAAGFCDQSHLSRLFKRYTGQTPAEYRLAVQAR